MKKKILCVLFTAALAGSLLGCTNRSADGYSSATPTGVSAGAPAPADVFRSI